MINKTSNTISAIILVGKNIDKILFKKCRDSLKWCDEIVEVDTSNIVGGFSDWRNEGLKKAKGEWVLYIDTDEEVSKSLCQEIQLTITNSQLSINAYAIPRKNIIFDKEFKHGGQWPDYQKRLFRKKSLKKWVGELHEEPQFSGNLGYIKNPIIHHKNITVSQMLDKTNAWSEIEAQLLFDSGHPKMNFIRFFSAGFREFILRFVKQLSFLDGPKGVIYGIYQIYSRLITYSKLWEKQQSTIHI